MACPLTPSSACPTRRARVAQPVRAAVLSSGLRWPDKRITVNLAPSGQRKSGSGLDLAIAVGVLVASGQLPADYVAGYGFVGELGLDGSVRRVPGVAPMVAAWARWSWCPRLGVGGGPRRHPSASGSGHVASGGRRARRHRAVAGRPRPRPRRAATAAAGPGRRARAARRPPRARARRRRGHHLLLVGPPGAGKTMLAQRLPGLLPALEPTTP